jgi:hypothetical protein
VAFSIGLFYNVGILMVIAHAGRWSVMNRPESPAPSFVQMHAWGREESLNEESLNEESLNEESLNEESLNAARAGLRSFVLLTLLRQHIKTPKENKEPLWMLFLLTHRSPKIRAR